MKPAGLLLISFVAFAIPLLIPVIQQFWPTADVWWSALLVVLLYALLSAIWLVYGRKLQKAGMAPVMPAPMADAAPTGPDDEDYGYYGKAPQPQGMVRTWLLG